MGSCKLKNPWCAAILGAALLQMPFSMGYAGEVAFLNWSEYTPEEVLSSFETEFGADVVHDTYSESDDAEALLHAGKSGYDVVVVGDEMVNRLQKSGALSPIDADRLPNATGVDRRLMERFYQNNPRARLYTQPYLWGYTGLAFERDKVLARIPDAPLDSLALIFDPENASRLADCGVYMVNSPEEVIGLALVYLGRDPLSEDPKDIDAAFEVVSEIAPYVQDIDSNHYDVMLAGEACLALTWNTEAVPPILEGENPNLSFVAPKEGTSIWFDAIVVPSDAPNPELAYELINHFLSPETSAIIAEWNLTPSAIPASRDLMSPEFTSDSLVFPSDAVLERWYIPRPLEPSEKAEFNRRWWRLFLGL